MGRLLRYLAVLAVLGAIGLAIYAMFGDLSPRQGEITVPATVDGG